MATTTRIKISERQRKEIARKLRIKMEKVPSHIGIVAVPPEAGTMMGLPQNLNSKFLPAMIVT